MVRDDLEDRTVMLLAILSDIHANREAFEAVLAAAPAAEDERFRVPRILGEQA